MMYMSDGSSPIYQRYTSYTDLHSADDVLSEGGEYASD